MAEKPVKKFRIGYVQATVWKNESNGNTFFSVELSRTFKDGDDYKNSNSLGHSDLLNASKLLQRAETWIADQ